MIKTLKYIIAISLTAVLFTCVHAPSIKKPVQKEHLFHAHFKQVWNESLTILIKSGAIIKTLNKDIGLIISELMLSPSQLSESVLEGGVGGRTFGSSQGKCIMNLLIKEKEDEKTNVFLNTRFIVSVYSSLGGKLGEAYLNSNGKIEEDFFEKLKLALGEKKYEWLTNEEKGLSPEEKPGDKSQHKPHTESPPLENKKEPAQLQNIKKQ